MDRPDTIIEIHRERVQDQTLDTYSGDTYTQPVNGTGYRATATLDLTLDRVWFVLDSHSRVWQEETGDGIHDPLRHFAIELAVFESKIVIDSVTCIPLIPLPPRTVTVPDGPRAGESRKIAYNEIPLFGRLTIHDQLERRQTEPGKETIALNFTAQDAPVLVATALQGEADEFASRLFGPHIERRRDGNITFGGQDPRVTWDLDYAEAYWITHCIAGELMVTAERLRHPGISDGDARTAVLDSIAGQIADSVRAEMAKLGDDGVVDLLPSELDVDPAAQDDSTVKALDAVVQRFDVGGVTHESMVVQLQTLRKLPVGEELPASLLAENPDERIGLAVTGWSILRQVRDTMMNSFSLSESDFVADAPCLLDGPKTVDIGGEERTMESFDADIVPRTGDGRLVVDGTVSAHTTLYDFDATFTVTYAMDLDDIPRDAAPNEAGTSGGETLDELHQALRAAAQKKREGVLTGEQYEAEVKRVNDLIKELPRTVGVRPEQRPEKPVVNPNFSLTAAGYAATAVGAAALVGLLALPVTWAVGAAGVGVAGAGGLLTLAIVEYITIVITIDWFGTGVGSREVRKALGNRPGGTLLPEMGIPIAVNLTRQRMAVYFRHLPSRLDVSCIKTKAEDDDTVVLIGGKWPTDHLHWTISADDGVLVTEAGELDLFVESDGEQPIRVASGADGRKHLTGLGSLPRCP